MGKCIPKHVVVLCFGSRKDAPNNYCAYLSLQKLLNLDLGVTSRDLEQYYNRLLQCSRCSEMVCFSRRHFGRAVHHFN